MSKYCFSKKMFACSFMLLLLCFGLSIGLNGYAEESYPIPNQPTIKEFIIGDMCQQSYPCIHTVKIVLEDGRQGEGSLDGKTIYTLIQSITDKDRIIGDIAHFDIYADFIEESAEEILLNLLD